MQGHLSPTGMGSQRAGRRTRRGGSKVGSQRKSRFEVMVNSVKEAKKSSKIIKKKKKPNKQHGDGWESW